MPTRTVLITGGAGFIGSSLALALRRRQATDRIVALDNLRRRGSELNVARLRQAGVEFVHGDVRNPADLEPLARGLDTIIECSAEPSVLAGRDGHPRYAIDSNLTGCVNVLEMARTSGAALVFLSTSRVYPIAALTALRYETRGSRFHLLDAQPVPGASARGISEDFPLNGARTLYGATKLAAELLVAEYADAYGLRAVVNRCGVVAGPWQMGRVDQGLVAHWAFAHVLQRPLAYIGFGGGGLQVRDILHVEDLVDLIALQLRHADRWSRGPFNVGGGAGNSLSLRELTPLCEAATGHAVPIGSIPETRPGDVPIYITDNTRVESVFDWRPSRSVAHTVADTCDWIAANQTSLAAVRD